MNTVKAVSKTLLEVVLTVSFTTSYHILAALLFFLRCIAYMSSVNLPLPTTFLYLTVWPFALLAITRTALSH